MNERKKQFINFLLKNQALLFGKFTLKSGRVSPYFFNLGVLNSGPQISKLGRFYAEAIRTDWKDEFDIIFGPAYKGIPLSVAIVDSMHRDFNINKKYSSNRKEMKTYADKSVLLGADIKDGDKIILVDDVLTTGQTKIDAVKLIKSIASVEIVGLMIALDRLEKNKEAKNAVLEFTEQTGVPVRSIVTASDIIETLDPDEQSTKKKVVDYLKQYGVIS